MDNELKKKERYSLLLILYGSLLTKNIYKRLELFYLNDYSITEISEIESVSRNAVFESLSHGEKQLEKYESKLKLMKRNAKLINLINRFEEVTGEEERKDLINEMKGEIGYGI